MKNGQMIVGVDVGGTNIRIGAVNDDFSLNEAKRIKTLQISGENASEKLLDFIANYIERLGKEVKVISIGFPSVLNRERTKVISTPNIIGMNNMPVKEQFEERLKVPVFIEKDACMLFCYDLHQHKEIPQDGILIGFYIGTGFGNIIIIDGQPLIGKNGVACELGHIPVIGKHDVCSCGLEGCLEMYAAGKGLEIIRKNHFPDTHISDIFLKHGDSQKIIEFVENIAKAIVIELHILNPDHIVLGGGVLAMKNFPYHLLEDRIHKFTRKPFPESSLSIIRSESNNAYNGVIGAAIYAKKLMRERSLNDSSGE
jgi:allose kinase